MGVAAAGVEYWLRGLVPGTSILVRMFHVGGGIVAGLVTLAVSARALAIAEFDQAVTAVLRRAARRAAS
jgi:hypothetical protein